MAQYIDKDALVAEIERRIKEITKEYQESKTIQYTLIGKINALENLLPFIDTLEVKEVDIEKEIEFEYNPIDGLSFEEFERIAKYFFELGLKTQKGVNQ